MRIIFLGCVQFSHTMLKHLLHSVSDAEIVGVVTRTKSSFNADFHSLEDIAAAAGIPCFIAEGNNQTDIADWMKKLAPDVAYCFGWSYLLEAQILQIPRLGVVGYHPAALPQNRGRHPIIWALALGLAETASTFFFMDACADSGDIVSQRCVPISPSDDAADLYNELEATARNQVSEFTLLLSKGGLVPIPQDQSKANYWRKRSKLDGQVDWRMPASSIHNLVRSLAKPYPGAHCIYDGKEIKIWKTSVSEDQDLINIEPGKILRVEGTDISVKCGGGVLTLISHDFTTLPQEGCYL